MKKSILYLIGTLSLTLNTCKAANLIEVFKEAYFNDPTYQQAVAQTQASQEGVSISLAALLPNLSFKMSPSQDRARNSGSITQSLLPARNITRTNEMKLQLTQTIFDFAKFSNLVGAQASAKQASANLNASFQDLLIRVSQAYFNILKDEENQTACQANKNALSKQLTRVKNEYKIGAASKADLYAAQAEWASIDTDCTDIALKLASDKEFLRSITNINDEHLATLGDSLPIVLPEPENMEAWVKKGLQQNWTIIANKYAVEAAKQNIREQFSGHLPSIDVEGDYDVENQRSKNGSGLISAGASQRKDTVFQLHVNVPIFSGGYVTAQTKQAMYKYQAAEKQLEGAERHTMFKIRESYLNIKADIHKLENDKIKLKSSLISLNNVKTSYHSGEATLVEVFTQQEKYYQSRQQYTSDRYTYVLNILKLKNQAGTLSVEDLKVINSWLKPSTNAYA